MHDDRATIRTLNASSAARRLRRIPRRILLLVGVQPVRRIAWASRSRPAFRRQYLVPTHPIFAVQLFVAEDLFA